MSGKAEKARRQAARAEEEATLEVVTLSTGGDYTAEFNTDKMEGRHELETQVKDMLRKGYALFLEDGSETERVYGYDAGEDAFQTQRTRDKKQKKVKLNVETVEEVAEKEAPSSKGPPAASSRSKRKRLSAVAPSAGG